jgi:hypothetical protein
MATERQSRSVFHANMMDFLLRAYGADAVAITETVDLKQFTLADTFGDAVYLETQFPSYISEISTLEWSRVSVGSTQLDDDIFDATRRDRLMLYRFYIRPRRIKHYLIRMWRAGGRRFWYCIGPHIS